ARPDRRLRSRHHLAQNPRSRAYQWMSIAMNDVSATNQNQGMDEIRERFQNLHEIVVAARARLDRNVWDYLIGGVETETTVRRNRLALETLAFRPRVLVNVSNTDTSGKVLG